METRRCVSKCAGFVAPVGSQMVAFQEIQARGIFLLGAVERPAILSLRVRVLTFQLEDLRCEQISCIISSL